MIARRNLLALAVVVDVALHARGRPVAAKSLAARAGVAPRHLEPLLQELVRANLLRGTRGPSGGYELARERRRITAADVVRVADRNPDDAGTTGRPTADLLANVVSPAVDEALGSFLAALDAITVEDLCRRAEERTPAAISTADFHI